MKNKLLSCGCLLLLYPVFSRAQCGLDPVSGLTTISTASQIVNSYYPGTGDPSVGSTSLIVGTLDPRGNTTPLAAGDLIFIMQMQGVDINSSNTDSYGNGVGGGTASGYLTSNLIAGYYEYNSVASVSGSTINLSYSLARHYHNRTLSGGGIMTYQVIRIPRYYDLTISLSGSITSPSWNGNTGGVVVLDAANVMTISGSINVTGLGFRGGGGKNFTGATSGSSDNGSGGALVNTDYRWNSPFTTVANMTGGAKGEGIAGTPVYVLNPGSTTTTINSSEGYINGSMGRGAAGNAGGGSTDGAPVGAGQNQFNSGGGGGGNAGTGGRGGSGWHGGSGNLNTYPYGGHGGSPFAQRSLARFVMGGGGGAGSANNSTAANEYMSSGGTGGGIILLRAKSYAGNGSLNANGGNAVGVTGGGGNTDAAGGGGGGGSIVAVTRQSVPTGLNNITANARGGNGGSMDIYYDYGPGGGGGGGVIMTNGAFSLTSITGGANGRTRNGSPAGPLNNAYGATGGTNGQLITLAGAPILQNANNVASPCGTLPVSLVSFRATANGSSVLLNWETDNALNFSHFEIEHGTSPSSFSSIGQVGFNPAQSRYQYNHISVTASSNFYRLKMVDIDGSFHYNNVLLVRMGDAINNLSVYPQPARDYLVVNMVVRQPQKATLRLLNAAGTVVKETRVFLNNGNNSLLIDQLGNLPGGIYLLQGYLDGKTTSVKMALNTK